MVKTLVRKEAKKDADDASPPDFAPHAIGDLFPPVLAPLAIHDALPPVPASLVGEVAAPLVAFVGFRRRVIFDCFEP